MIPGTVLTTSVDEVHDTKPAPDAKEAVMTTTRTGKQHSQYLTVIRRVLLRRE